MSLHTPARSQLRSAVSPNLNGESIADIIDSETKVALLGRGWGITTDHGGYH